MLVRASLVKNFHFDQSYTSVYTSLCCQSLAAPSFLNIWPQKDFLPHITVIVHSDSERGIFPSAAVTFQCSWCLVAACLHPALFFTEYTKPVYKGNVWAAIFSRKNIYLHTVLLLSFKYTNLHNFKCSEEQKNKQDKKNPTNFGLHHQGNFLKSLARVSNLGVNLVTMLSSSWHSFLLFS